MKFNKLMGATMAGALALSMSVSAFAADVTDLTEGAELEVSGSTQGATISLTVPTSAAIVVNPYGMSTDLTGNKTAQVISPIYFVENNSSLDIKVDIAVTATTEGDAKLVADTANLTDNDAKNLYAYLAFEAVTDADSDTVTSVDNTNKIVLATAKATDSATLEATDGDTGTAKDVLAFTFDGEANDKSASPWTSEDTVAATVAFTFSVDNGAAAGGGDDDANG